VKKQFIAEAARMQKLAGITEAKVVPSNTVPSNKDFINIQDIKDEMKDFYSLDVSNSDVKDWLQSYHYDRIEDDPDYDGDFVFDTTEREDFFLYLKDR
jgi:hypothetical protein